MTLEEWGWGHLQPQPHSSSILPAKTHSRLASLVERLLSICPIHYQRKVNLSLNMRWKQNERYRKRVSEEEAVVVVVCVGGVWATRNRESVGQKNSATKTIGHNGGAMTCRSLLCSVASHSSQG